MILVGNYCFSGGYLLFRHRVVPHGAENGRGHLFESCLASCFQQWLLSLLLQVSRLFAVLPDILFTFNNWPLFSFQCPQLGLASGLLLRNWH